LLQVQNLSKTYGAAIVLDGVSFVLNDGEHVGLIGPNGAGKSTLIRCVVGEEHPDGGTVALSPAGATVGYLPQALGASQQGRSLGEAVTSARAELVEAERAVQRAADALAERTGEELEAAMGAYDAALVRFEALGGYEREQRAAVVLQRLGLAEIDPDTPVAALSGGQKTRLGLALLLLREPDLLLLDEPTNHLDVQALEWLEGFVRAYPRSALVVSHDREFLDRTVSRVLYLDPETRAARSYPGGYSDFVAARDHELALQEETWQQQQAYVGRVERDVARLKDGALRIERSTTPREPGVRKLARKKAQLAKSRERKLERFVESDERVDRPRLRWGLNFDVARRLVGEPPPSGRAVLELDDVAFGYPGSALLFDGASLDVRYGQRVAVVGPNGAGKTTLLRLIEGRLPPTDGRLRLGANVRVGTLAQEQETLDPDRTVLQTVLAERPMSETEARGFLPMFLFSGESVFTRVGACSPGERARLQLALLILRGCNLLLLDEPLNHLDIEAREHFEAALHAFEGTIIAVAHDRAFLRTFAERVVEVRDGRVTVFEGDYGYYLRQQMGKSSSLTLS
jgi:ATP-binding cassette subfamily F protein 3